MLKIDRTEHPNMDKINRRICYCFALLETTVTSNSTDTWNTTQYSLLSENDTQMIK